MYIISKDFWWDNVTLLCFHDYLLLICAFWCLVSSHLNSNIAIPIRQPVWPYKQAVSRSLLFVELSLLNVVHFCGGRRCSVLYSIRAGIRKNSESEAEAAEAETGDESSRVETRGSSIGYRACQESLRKIKTEIPRLSCVDVQMQTQK